MAAPAIYDVLIIGAGPAGLSTALGLARQTYSALVFDSNRYRNAPADRMHNVLSWDHKPPAEFRAAARENILSRYKTVDFKDATIVSAAKREDGLFELTDKKKNKYHGKKLALATGVTDVFPDIKGFGDLWGKLIFHCLFCHGYEERGASSAGILATGALTQPFMLLHVARMAVPLAERLTVYSHGDNELTTKLKGEFEGKPLTIESRKIISVERKGENKVIVQLEDGESKEEGFLASMPSVKVNGPFHEQLGLEVDLAGFIKVNAPFNEASVPGVFAMGDCGTMVKTVSQAMTMGSFGAAGLVSQLGAMGKL
ncbi:hypothetical protein N8T08_009492 [Aspergillus melleus]|uniref:Uncharacterized protein n=1 Tax=Aspergillus melleus TaxID=138277 RepID=A0ACC3BD32_9EURO|nr:hypothetical protein N8T08_009492 [Aspergillus melleus]